MAFEADIIVSTVDGLALVVEAKVALPDLQQAEQQLKDYMVQMQCPVGMLVTPERLWLYRDSYLSRASQSVELVGEFDAREVWRDAPPLEGVQFEAFVQRWLEQLGQQPMQRMPKNLREALQEYVLPAVRGGEIRAAHPRYL